MKIVQKMGAQGDVLFRRVKSIPKGANLQKRKGPLVVAHSETGHHHVIESPDVKLYTTADPMICYLRLEGVAHADVVHQRPHDTHETLRLSGTGGRGGACFEVRRQREWTPEGWRQVAD